MSMAVGIMAGRSSGRWRMGVEQGARDERVVLLVFTHAGCIVEAE